MDDVVVLPHMSVTLAVRAMTRRRHRGRAPGQPADPARPRIDGKFGTSARARLANPRAATGAEAFMIRGEYRARLGSGQADIGGALWVKADPILDPEPRPRRRSSCREYRALLENLVESRGVRRSCSSCAPRGLPATWPTSPATRLTLDEQKLEILENADLEERLTKLITWTKGALPTPR